MTLTERALVLALCVAVPLPPRTVLALESLPSRLQRQRIWNVTSSNATLPPVTIGNLTNGTNRSKDTTVSELSDEWHDCFGPMTVCSMPDLGSCGNACCAVETTIDAAPDEAYGSLVSFFTTNQFAWVNTYQQIHGVQENLSSLPMDVGAFRFHVQGIHLTSAERMYSHSLDFNIRAATKNGNAARSVLRGFSISNMHGALEDEGENGKVLLSLFDSIGAGNKVNTLYGCGKVPQPWKEAALVPSRQGNSSCGDAGGAPKAPQPCKVEAPLAPVSTGSSYCSSGGEVPDCERVDVGSCGSACCVVEISLKAEARELYEGLASFLDGGSKRGPFERDHGTAYFNGHPPENLTSLLKEWKYLVKGKHSSSDRSETLNFNIRSGSPGTSILRAFSMSDGTSAQAISDAGQNYKNLVFVFDGLGLPRKPIHMLYGCGIPSAAVGGNFPVMTLILSGLLAAHLRW